MKNRYQIVKNIQQKDGLYKELIHGIIGLGNFSQDMKRRMKTILGWYSSLVV
ncbi:MAG: hypothetical protein L0H55_12210 [Candidatus Nitrosocosmicus sp.]|nr:hypothetical protein [Candidatus Nitrosocosmicus sp.]